MRTILIRIIKLSNRLDLQIIFSPLSKKFFSRPAELVAPDLIGCLLIKRESSRKLIWGVIVETEAYSQEEPACHGYKKKTQRNKTLMGPPGHLYIYLTYGSYYCVNIVTHKENWANGVLLRALAMPGENEKIASGPGLLAKRFGLNKSHNNLPISIENDIWLTEGSYSNSMNTVVRTTRIGIKKAKYLKWRWYLQQSRSVSKRAKGDRCPSIEMSWEPSPNCIQ